MDYTLGISRNARNGERDLKRLTFGLIVVLAIAHQDFWWWDDSDTLVFGVLPVGLAYHAGISVMAAILWALAVRFCWPAYLDDVESESHENDSTKGAQS